MAEKKLESLVVRVGFTKRGVAGVREQRSFDSACHGPAVSSLPGQTVPEQFLPRQSLPRHTSGQAGQAPMALDQRGGRSDGDPCNGDPINGGRVQRAGRPGSRTCVLTGALAYASTKRPAITARPAILSRWS